MVKKVIVANSNIKKSKIFEITKLVSVVGSTQALLQAVGMVTGILIIRMLPTKEYAYYTLANTMLGTMVLLSDSGIGIGVMSEGGKVWQDQRKLGQVLDTGLQLRKVFGIVSVCVISPILLYLLLHNHASLLESIFIITALIPAFIASLSDSILEIVPRLHQDLKPLQKNQVGVSLMRLFLSYVGLLLIPLTVISFVANALPRIMGNIKLRKIATKYVKLENKINTETRDNILKVVKRTLPSAVYYCFAGQISIWVISVFGKTTSIAAIGALGRIAFITNLIATVFAMLITPRFARMEQRKGALLKGYISSQGLLAVSLIFIIFSTWLFSTPILSLLGSNYRGLSTELVLCVVSSSLGVMTGASLNLYTSRGWVINPVINILVNITALIIGVSCFDLVSLKGVLLMGIFIALIEFVVNFSFGALKIMKLSHDESSI